MVQQEGCKLDYMQDFLAIRFIPTPGPLFNLHLLCPFRLCLRACLPLPEPERLGNFSLLPNSPGDLRYSLECLPTNNNSIPPTTAGLHLLRVKLGEGVAGVRCLGSFNGARSIRGCREQLWA